MKIQDINPDMAVEVNYPGHNKHGEVGIVAAVRQFRLGERCEEVTVYFHGDRYERTFKPENLKH